MVSETTLSLSETGFLLPCLFCFNRERCDSLFCSLFTAKPTQILLIKSSSHSILDEVLPFLIYDLSMNDRISLAFHASYWFYFFVSYTHSLSTSLGSLILSQRPTSCIVAISISLLRATLELNCFLHQL